MRFNLNRIMGLGLFAMLCWVIPPAATASVDQPRHLHVIIDTSKSMIDNDEPRYTLQLAKVLSDLLSDRDELTLYRFQFAKKKPKCADAADQKLAIRLDSANRSASKQAVDNHIQYDSGDTIFTAPIRTAERNIQKMPPDAKAMLLLIADSGGLKCPQSNQLLAKLRAAGVTIAAINIDKNANRFDYPFLDFSETATSASQLVQVVGAIYQKFIGGKQFGTGDIRSEIRVQIPPLVKDAYLVVAADGAVQRIDEAAGNPGSRAIDTNYQGGGATRGKQGRVREYKIVRLTEPEAGEWRFRYQGVRRGGWVLIQESLLGLRMVSGPTFAKDAPTPVVVEVYDKETGQAITDPDVLNTLSLTVESEGRTYKLSDDGTQKDQKARDGRYNTQISRSKSGLHTLQFTLSAPGYENTIQPPIEVVDASWRIRPGLKSDYYLGEQVLIQAEIQPHGHAALLTPPDKLVVTDSQAGSSIELNDQGVDGDKLAGDRLYAGYWTPEMDGTRDLAFSAHGGSPAPEMEQSVQVIGILKLDPLPPIDFGELTAFDEKQVRLKVSGEIKGIYSLELASDFIVPGAGLEIEVDGEWRSLHNRSVTLQVGHDQPNQWRVRLASGFCLRGIDAPPVHRLMLSGPGPTKQAVSTEGTVAAQFINSTWLACYWWLLALLAAAALISFIVYGYIYPFGFSRSLGLQISADEDIDEEGFFYRIRDAKGSGIGFYRHARIYLLHDHRLYNKNTHALCLLRAGQSQVTITPLSGQTVLRQNFTGEWEPVSDEGEYMGVGVPYKSGSGGLYFELRVK